MKTLLISENDAGQRADKFLGKAFAKMPQSLLYRALRQKKIKLNRRRCEPQCILTAGDVLDIYLPDDVLETKKHSVVRNLPPPEIVYEDDNILIADKPKNLPCHDGEDSLIARVTAYLIASNAYSPDDEASFVPSLCNRLDRNTAGLVIAAKNARALRLMNECIREGGVTKTYICRVTAKPPKQRDVLTAYHRKDERMNKAEISDIPLEGCKKIVTGYRVMSESPKGGWLLEITLYTGRSHQIRAHLAHIGCPVAGDVKYGGKPSRGGQELQAVALNFTFAQDSPLYYLDGKSFCVKTFEEGSRNIEG